MATTLSRHHGNYARPQKTLPITMPTKNSKTYTPQTRVALEPPEISDTSTTYSRSRSDGTFSDISNDYESSRYPTAIDVVDELTDRMDKVWDPTKMDKSIARQAQTWVASNCGPNELNLTNAQIRPIERQAAGIGRFASTTETAKTESSG